VPVRDTFIRAINEKRPLRVMREGHERFICPYRIGRSSKQEYNVLHYQYGGYSQRGLGPDGSSSNWRCHHLDSFSEAEIIDAPWRGPTVKPKTRGACVVDADAEIADYY
jgi:hypothetical protein